MGTGSMWWLSRLTPICLTWVSTKVWSLRSLGDSSLTLSGYCLLWSLPPNSGQAQTMQGMAVFMNIPALPWNNELPKHYCHPFVFTQVYRHVALLLSGWDDGSEEILLPHFHILTPLYPSIPSAAGTLWPPCFPLAWILTGTRSKLCTSAPTSHLPVNWGQRKHTTQALEGHRCCSQSPCIFSLGVLFTDISTLPHPPAPGSALTQHANSLPLPSLSHVHMFLFLSL